MAAAGEVTQAPMNGAVPAPAAVGGGLPAVIRIPLPGPGNLALSLSPPNGWKGRSTSTLFIMENKWRGLRLDYGFNVKTNTINYHWNRTGFASRFPNIANHMPAGRLGAALYQSARAFRYAGTALVVIGALLDLESIVTASNPLRRSTAVVSAWAMALVGARGAGALGAAAGTAVEPGAGTAIGGLVFGVGGGILGYWAGEHAGEAVYDWAADTVFTSLIPVPVPPDMLDRVPQ
jgi:hypothetical protein